MSKRKSFGRFTAMSLAGISAVSSMAIVAYADAYPTTVYEFTYKGIASTALSAKAQSAIDGNEYVSIDAAKAVFENGFKVENLDDFGFDALYAGNYISTLNSGKSSTWVYKSETAFTGVQTPVLPEDYIIKRDGSGAACTEEVFYFKTKSERDSAMSLIASKNKSEYTTKYNAAYKALANELAKIADAHKTEEEKVAKAGKDAAYADYKNDLMTKEEYNTYIDETYEPAMEAAKKNHDNRDAAAKVVLAEFAEAYAPANRGFAHSEKHSSDQAEDYAVFLVDDSDPYVEIYGIAGSTYEQASYDCSVTGHALPLNECKYRTQSTYQDEDSYAFKGEIVLSTTLATLTNHGNYLVAGDYWQQFSSSIKGSNSNNANSSDSSESTKDEDEETKTYWYPQSASYRIPNTSNISYLGKNKYWYTSAAAAEVYGGGYAGTTMASNYTDVKGKAKIYFCAVDGKYYTTNTNSYSYLVEENDEDETTTNTYSDPYYYYYLMSQNGGLINTTTKVDPDAPTIYGSTKRAGWAKILAAVKATSNGTVTIDMNGATTIPSDVIKAAAANNVTIKAVNANGSIFTINGKDVSYATSIDTTVAYNVRVVSDNLKKKAISVNKGAISTTQLAISEDGSLGTNATVTVKLSAKRAGCTVKAYRASNNGKKLTLEAKGTVKSNGSVSLNLENGGKYVLVIIE